MVHVRIFLILLWMFISFSFIYFIFCFIYFIYSDWILAVGPVINAQYQWAVVSDNFNATLFILARDVDTYNKM